jgi:hypothetical protein
VTDLAQSYFQQNGAALVEDLDSYNLETRLSLTEVAIQLYGKLIAGGATHIGSASSPGLTDTAARHFLCIDAIRHVKAYLEVISPADSSRYPLMSFLQHFDAVRGKKVTLPV